MCRQQKSRLVAMLFFLLIFAVGYLFIGLAPTQKNDWHCQKPPNKLGGCYFCRPVNGTVNGTKVTTVSNATANSTAVSIDPNFNLTFFLTSTCGLAANPNFNANLDACCCLYPRLEYLEMQCPVWMINLQTEVVLGFTVCFFGVVFFVCLLLLEVCIVGGCIHDDEQARFAFKRKEKMRKL